MRIKPAPGFAVIDPDRGDHLPAEGRDIVLSAYWRRRLEDGDVLQEADAEAGVAKSANPPSRKGA